MIELNVLTQHALARALSATDLRAFVEDGVSAAALSRAACDRLSMVARERVIFEGSRFDFERDRPDAKAINAFTLPVFDESAEPADILAFRPGLVGLWLGRVAILGAEQLHRTRPDLGEALEVHESVLDWLRAGRTGIFIVDHRRAADEVDGLTLRTASADHARLLRSALERPAPRIVVATQVAVPAREQAA